MILFKGNADLSTSEGGEYCAIRWRGTSDIRVESASSLGKSLSSITLYEVLTIEDAGRRREARIIFKGQSDKSKLMCKFHISRF